MILLEQVSRTRLCMSIADCGETGPGLGGDTMRIGRDSEYRQTAAYELHKNVAAAARQRVSLETALFFIC